MKKTFLMAVVVLSVFMTAPAFACDGCGGAPACGSNCAGYFATGGHMWVDMNGSANAWGSGENVDVAAFSSGSYDMNAALGNDDFVDISGGYMAGGSDHNEVNVGGSANSLAEWGNFRGWDAPAGW